jgi:hypothetical protein
MYYCQAASSLLLWIKLFYYAKIFPETSYLVRAIISIAWECKVFFFMYLIAALAFADAFRSASEYQKTLDHKDDAIFYDRYIDGFVGAYLYMMASTGDINKTGDVLTFVIFIMCSVFMYLMMLNLLIASVGKTFAKISET